MLTFKIPDKQVDYTAICMSVSALEKYFQLPWLNIFMTMKIFMTTIKLSCNCHSIQLLSIVCPVGKEGGGERGIVKENYIVVDFTYPPI